MSEGKVDCIVFVNFIVKFVRCLNLKITPAEIQLNVPGRVSRDEFCFQTRILKCYLHVTVHIRAVKYNGKQSVQAAEHNKRFIQSSHK